MKAILIAWFVVSGDTAGSGITAEFDSMESCEAAALTLQKEGNRGAGKNVKWRYICSPK